MIADYDVGGLASSDPYVKATVGDYTKRCKTITNNLYPVWNEKCRIHVCHFTNNLMFEIKDKVI